MNEILTIAKLVSIISHDSAECGAKLDEYIFEMGKALLSLSISGRYQMPAGKDTAVADVARRMVV